MKKKVRVMPVNDFEKQVQQRMDELQLRPSAEVWEEVEKRIRKEKKRRWFILWFFLLGALLLGGTGWWLLTNKKQTTSETTIAKTTIDKKSINNPVAEKEIITENTTINGNKNQETKIDDEKMTTSRNIVSPVNRTKNNIKIQTSLISNKEPGNKKSKKVNSTNRSLRVDKKHSSQGDVIAIIRTNEMPESIDKQEKKTITMENNTIADKNVKNDDSIFTGKRVWAVAEEDKLKTFTTATKDSLTVEPSETVVKKDSSNKKSNKWEIGVTGMVGVSAKSDGVSLFGMEKSLDATPANLNNAGQGGQFATVRPRQPSNGFAWQLGVYTKKDLSVKTGISIGLGFSSYSSTQPTGLYVDSTRVYNNGLYSSSVRSFYRSGSGSVFNNRYYYLQLPLSFHWQINKGKKVPVIFQNGLAPGFLIASNALVYNEGSNVFYKDNKSFNKLQLSYQSGLSVKLFNLSKNPFTAGLIFNYHITKQQKTNIYGGNHLTSFGIQLGWILKK